jgi:hypothetical protein
LGFRTQVPSDSVSTRLISGADVRTTFPTATHETELEQETLDKNAVSTGPAPSGCGGGWAIGCHIPSVNENAV